VLNARVADSADVDDSATIGEGSSVWHLAQIREGASLGLGCVIGRGAYIGSDVRLGDYCKVQNYALVYEPAELGDGVFVGPAVVLTNDQYPRAINPDGSLKSAHDWETVGVTIRDGAAIGARSVCIAPVTTGRWALVAAGSVVTRDVPDFAIAAGNSPSTAAGSDVWVCLSTKWARRNGCVRSQANCTSRGRRARSSLPWRFRHREFIHPASSSHRGRRRASRS
jgi:UDP-2-acetamido-3-amino-2,3-dideoxy-glucuronate N-acetyltransferase